jgi:hypothetical protein
MNPTLVWLDQFYNDFHTLKVLDALDILCESLQCGAMFWDFRGSIGPITNLYCDKDLFNLPAWRLHAKWLGGPPDGIQWRHGSLLALVTDRCLVAMNAGRTAQVCNAIKLAEKYGCYKYPIEPIDCESRTVSITGHNSV